MTKNMTRKVLTIAAAAILFASLWRLSKHCIIAVSDAGRLTFERRRL